MSEIIEKLSNKIDFEKPIAYIFPKSKTHFTLKWLGSLDDEFYWEKKAIDPDFEIKYIKE